MNKYTHMCISMYAYTYTHTKVEELDKANERLKDVNLALTRSLRGGAPGLLLPVLRAASVGGVRTRRQRGRRSMANSRAFIFLYLGHVAAFYIYKCWP